MKVIKTYEDWDGVNIYLKDYLIMDHGNSEKRMAIMKVVQRYKDMTTNVNKVRLKRIYLFDMMTGKDLNEYSEDWIYTLEYVINNMLYQSNNIQDLLDIKDLKVQTNKYNI
jgi:hypothetical protein